MRHGLIRPLSVAGRVIIKEIGKLVTKLVRVDKDLLVIPNLAIHMNREANTNVSYNAQVDSCRYLVQKMPRVSLWKLWLNLLA